MLRCTQTKRHNVISTSLHGVNFYSPMVIMPEHYWQRVANQKQVELTDKRDPKFYLGKRNKEFLGSALHPSLWAGDRHNVAHFDNKGGMIMEAPPIPVYREKIWCIGQFVHRNFHPRIFLKVPRGKVIGCKWCRARFINMATDEDNDDDWEEVTNRIQKTPESKNDLMRPFRNINGVWPKNDRNFPEGVEPDQHIYRTVFDPLKNYYEKYNIPVPEDVRLRIEEEKDQPMEWKPAEVRAAERKARQEKLAQTVEGETAKVSS